MKYLVMECHLSYAVVLAEDGRFLKVANRQYQVGQTVTEVIEMQIPAPRMGSETKKKKKITWIYPLAAVAACLIFTITGLLRAPYASIYMTINPEVRIDVNRLDQVIEAEGVNADGKDLLEGYDYKKKDLDQVMDELADRAIDMGYLHEGGTITLTLDGADRWVVGHEEQLGSQLKQYLTDRITVVIDVETFSPGQTVSPETTAPQIETESGSAGETVMIPVGPAKEDSDYGDEDYGDTDYDEPTEPADVDTDYGPVNDGDTDYEEPADIDTDYGPGNDGDTDYEEPADIDTDYGPDNDGDTDYEDRTDGDTDYGDSDYD